MLGGNVRRRLQATARFRRSPGGRLRLGGAWWGGRGPWWVAGGLVFALAAVVTWVLWPTPEGPQPRERQYRDLTACLLTDAHGVTGTEAAPVWAGMQSASLKTLAKVQFLEVDGAQTAENAQTYLASLVQSRCDLVLAVGTPQLAALAVTAPKYPDIKFVAVGGTASGANVSVVRESSSDAVRDRVDTLVTQTFGTEPKN